MIKRIFFITSLFVSIIGCSSLDFVYNNAFQITNKINENILLSISGDNKDIINNLNCMDNFSLLPIYKASMHIIP